MYFNKIPHPANFDFVRRYQPGSALQLGNRTVRLTIDAFEDDVFRIRCRGRGRKGDARALAPLTPPPVRKRTAGAKLVLTRRGQFLLTDARGKTLLSSPAGMGFGRCGQASLYLFRQEAGTQCYGLGEKTFGLERSGLQTKFWNTDVFADFPFSQIEAGDTDPFYASIPYLIVKRGNTYLGLLLDNAEPAFISTGAEINIAGQMELAGQARKALTLGAYSGPADLYVLVGPSLPELTRKLQRLVGVTPRPPVWALGYHQCRWGYRSAEDLEALDRKFTEHKIPCDGLWLDIDYMQDFKVFSVNRDHFPNFRSTLRALRAKGRRVVPIIDPGVKKKKGYNVYDDGRKHEAFCRHPGGGEFTGLVWPGETAFPDFSLASARSWWARHTAAFARQGIDGCWIDMNDPSTGAVDNEAMLFQHGEAPHHAYHNQYALGMAMATRAGFEQAHPEQRPFVVSRSGSTGVSRYAALWTGDNLSSYTYLKKAIPCSLNLALSGVPFNGPDVGGFCGDTTPQLLADWQKACFLFPFCRNHTIAGTRDQEPWAFDRATLRTVRHYIRLRYKLRPYLYNLFVDQEERGEAILRPLFYDFKDTKSLPLGHIEDQFMVGPHLLQAPLLDEHRRTRSVVLPGRQRWFSVLNQKWLRGGRTLRVKPGPEQTPLFVREGALLPMALGMPEENGFDGDQVECHVFLRRNSTARAASEYVYDDGLSLDYQQHGGEGRVQIRARVQHGILQLRVKPVRLGGTALKLRFVLYDRFTETRLNGHAMAVAPSSWTCCGSTLTTQTTAEASFSRLDAV